VATRAPRTTRRRDSRGPSRPGSRPDELFRAGTAGHYRPSGLDGRPSLAPCARKVEDEKGPHVPCERKRGYARGVPRAPHPRIAHGRSPEWSSPRTTDGAPRPSTSSVMCSGPFKVSSPPPPTRLLRADVLAINRVLAAVPRMPPAEPATLAPGGPGRLQPTYPPTSTPSGCHARR
jgi:hypothetical protein